MIVFSAVREATPSNKYKKYEIGGVTFRVTCILLISMETTKDKRALFDREKISTTKHYFPTQSPPALHFC